MSELDKSDDLNQQIFVTTHSSNISAVAGIDNMFMLAYSRDGEIPDCRQQSLSEQFKDIEGTTFKTEAKVHLTKFLDVTRSDMLFADKVILVEGISEKMLLPLFMEICNCCYEDEHISIVEIGGKHFNYFLELYNGNAVKKDVLCITDKDFNWIDFDSDVKLKSRSDYENTEPKHIIELKRRFNFDNFHICTQTLGGRTFEDEFFLANMEDQEVAKKIFKKAVSDKTNEFIDVLQALKLYATIDVKKLTPKVIFQISKLSHNVFVEVIEKSYTCKIIERFNIKIRKNGVSRV